ncbi:hypothetical protein [Terasakiella pusilla]|uniref:hypothetical protein n=1 Tax=Terasakiella pusilla TaxID=64973 RepID=UPI003AA9A93A
MFEWLGQQPQGVATFLGAMAGASIGLIAILIGALFNAHLNRKRDDRERKLKSDSLLRALRGELVSVRQVLSENGRAFKDSISHDCDLIFPDPSLMIKIYPKLIDKIGSIETGDIQTVYDAYTILEQLPENLLLLGAKEVPISPSRTNLSLESDKGIHAAEMYASAKTFMENAISVLDQEIGDHSKVTGE